MSVIRVVWGTATGPTELAAYDAALAEAGVADYNLAPLSSVIPADPAFEVVGEAPDLGPVGNELRVVQSEAVAGPGESVAAGIGWARRADGAGIFYEVTGADAAAVRAEIDEGLAAGRAQRGWEFVEQDAVVREAASDQGATDGEATGDGTGVDAATGDGTGVDAATGDGEADDARGDPYAAAVVLATYGESRPVV